ncbi:uncharacterized protein LOC116844029 [Odontomachus brunneus]|uniref:uncharacterized protein LOC116844029 n=1 Tax=Odontomachus brunneus TaxID=486640 RepID=UPI0013F1FC13|nr:uncharacterized protein LOC116844029 [Odontomachus brunneus]
MGAQEVLRLKSCESVDVFSVVSLIPRQAKDELEAKLWEYNSACERLATFLVDVINFDRITGDSQEEMGAQEILRLKSCESVDILSVASLIPGQAKDERGGKAVEIYLTCEWLAIWRFFSWTSSTLTALERPLRLHD